eukprot:TRINITY_DN72141_c0_g1_i1.p1 TRINITY_DN72141_c0_g1~~TRINITY_DN72141_c0_g1_i1.p1  ORF type:complete len:782 (+),score=154.34 TRINITY_DN72141_c0_g1_i1:86-2431(+)
MGSCGTKVGAETDHNGDAVKVRKDENLEYKNNMLFLSKVPLFRRLPQSDHPLLALACKPVSFPQGTKIFKQGDPGSEMFVIKKGEAEVSVCAKDGGMQVVACLKAGDYFGEMALLREAPRTATITAKTDIHALKIERSKFWEMKLNEKLTFPKRKAVGVGKLGGLVVKEPSPKTSAERELIADALRNAENLRMMVQMDEERIQAMIDVAWKEVVTAGTSVIKEGDLQADYFYIIQSGQFDVLQADQESVRDGLAVQQCVGKLGKGQYFGELALLYLTPRAATVQAKVDSVLWCFDRKNFKAILMKQSEKKVREYVSYLDQVDLFAPMFAEEKKAMAEALVEMHFVKDDVVLRQGEPGTTFYILYQGDVSVIKDGKQEATLSAKSMKDAKVFGERALLKGEPRAATLMVSSSTAKALVLDRESFNMILGPLEDIISRGAQGSSKAKKIRPSQMARSHESILKKDLKIIGLLGCGGFGAVELVEHVKSNPKKTYALKGLSKGFICKLCSQDAVLNEKDILLMTQSPFIVKLYETYNDGEFLYFLLEPCLGGELHATYNRKGFYGSEKHCKFYAAGVTMGFEHLHERRIIYRDLKPENLLLSENGKLVITDMGLAKFAVGKTYSVCGTPDYFAPELIASAGHTIALDWWTLGILIFELMAGNPPFEASYPMQIYVKVQKGIGKVNFPAKCQGGGVEKIIRDLLKENPEERLPVRPGGIANIQGHPWYHGFEWAAFTEGTLQPPFVPKVRGVTDKGNFSARPEDRPPEIKYKDDGSKWDKGFATC